MQNTRGAVTSIAVVLLLGAGIAWAGSYSGERLGAVPVFALCVALIYAIQWAVFIPSYAAQSERFFDLTGSLTYLSVTTLAVVLSPPADVRQLVLLAVVVVWAARLGSFLFLRIRRAGKDDRFDDIKPSFWRFLNVWTIQGLWVSLTAAAALAAITSGARASGASLDGLAGGIDAWLIAGLAVWIAGFSIEATADYQKNRFRAQAENRGAFIHTGLWAWSRHPNYFGEIVLWTGVALMAVPVLQGWQFVCLVSPAFVFLLLTRVSGIPLLEKKADERWGGQVGYEQYKAKTPVLFPRPPSR